MGFLIRYLISLDCDPLPAAEDVHHLRARDTGRDPRRGHPSRPIQTKLGRRSDAHSASSGRRAETENRHGRGLGKTGPEADAPGNIKRNPLADEPAAPRADHLGQHGRGQLSAAKRAGFLRGYLFPDGDRVPDERAQGGHQARRRPLRQVRIDKN